MLQQWLMADSKYPLLTSYNLLWRRIMQMCVWWHNGETKSNIFAKFWTPFVLPMPQKMWNRCQVDSFCRHLTKCPLGTTLDPVQHFPCGTFVCAELFPPKITFSHPRPVMYPRWEGQHVFYGKGPFVIFEELKNPVSVRKGVGGQMAWRNFFSSKCMHQPSQARES